MNTSVDAGRARTATCANRSSASAYGLIEPDTSMSRTTRRARGAARRCSSRVTSPPSRSARRTVRAGWTAPTGLGRRRREGRIGAAGRSTANSRRRCATLGRAELGDVAVPQHLGGAGPDGELLGAGLGSVPGRRRRSGAIAETTGRAGRPVARDARPLAAEPGAKAAS